MFKRGRNRLICFPFVGDTLGGSHISAIQLLRNLRSPYQPLIVLHQEGPLSTHLESLGMEYRFLPLSRYVTGGTKKLRYVGKFTATIGPLWHFIRQYHVDAVHSQDGRIHQTWTVPARLAGRPLIWHQRSIFPPARLSRTLVRQAHRVIAISRFVADSLPSIPQQRIQIIENPCDLGGRSVDRATARANLASELNCSKERPFVAFVGNMTRQKRPDVFVETAARLLRSAKMRPLFLIFGADRDGMQARLKSRVEELRLNRDVLFMGFRTPAEEVIAGCDLLLAPAVNEGFGRTLVEAMAVGTPVIAARSGGHTEIIEDGKTGILVCPDHPDAFAAAALHVISDRARAISIAGRAKCSVYPRFSIEHHVDQTCDVYDAVLNA